MTTPTPGLIFQHDGTVYQVISSRPVGNRGYNIVARPICDGWRTNYTYLFFVNTAGEIRS